MQIPQIDPLMGISIVVGVNLLLTLWNSYILYKKGAIGKSDVYMLFKIMATVMPYITNKAVQAAFNEIMHIIARRLGFEIDEELEEKFKKALEELENLTNRTQQVQTT